MAYSMARTYDLFVERNSRIHSHNVYDYWHYWISDLDSQSSHCSLVGRVFAYDLCDFEAHTDSVSSENTENGIIINEISRKC